ncbi:hypothetical protein TNCV_3079281 [Trichonephila clavipes]|nr:hypothetical protein TNCV_3079281 [Trichonephila clavipes]
MSRFGGLSEERPSVFKTRSKLGTHLSTQCSGDERQSRPCAAQENSFYHCEIKSGTGYLTHLQTRAKWSVQNPNLMENQLLKDPNTKLLDWPMGRILEVFPGSDGLVRVVNVETSTDYDILRQLQQSLTKRFMHITKRRQSLKEADWMNRRIT